MDDTEPLVLPYRAFDLERREMVVRGRTFDGPHAVAQVWGVMECACEILGQLRKATPEDAGDGRQRISTTEPVIIASDPRFGPAEDDAMVSASVATVALEAVRRMFEAAAAEGGYEPAYVSWSAGQGWIGRLAVEAPDVRGRLRDAGGGRRPGQACIFAWHDLALARCHGEDAWPREAFAGWYVAQRQPDGR